MSGICAVWRKDDIRQTAGALGLIAGGLSLETPECVETRIEQIAGVGVCSRFVTQQIHQNGRVLIACDADIYNVDELRGLVSHTEDAEVPEKAKTAALLAALYERFGPAFVEKL